MTLFALWKTLKAIMMYIWKNIVSKQVIIAPVNWTFKLLLSSNIGKEANSEKQHPRLYNFFIENQQKTSLSFIIT